MRGKHKFSCEVKVCFARSEFVPYCEGHAKTILGVEVRPSTLRPKKMAGRGLFATREFKRGERIALYGGEKLTPAEVDARYGEDGLAAYSLTIHPKRLVLDAITVRGYGSMANDGRSAHPCNARFSRSGENGEVRATRRIRAGEEIFASYGREYWTWPGFLTKDSKKSN